MTPSFSKAAHKKLAQLVRESAEHCKAGLIALLEQQPSKALVKPMKKARLAKEKQKKLTKKEDWEAIKAAVRERSGGRCEFTYSVSGTRCPSSAADVDHWENGNGRRVPKQSVANCWNLCRWHHVLRQTYELGAAYWNAVFAQHCAKYSYPFVPHIEHAKLSTPSVPEAGSPLPSAKGIGGVDLKQEQLSEKEG